MLEIRPLLIKNQVGYSLNCFFESTKGFGFPNSCRKTVPSRPTCTWTRDLKGPIAHFSLGSNFQARKHQTSLMTASATCCNHLIAALSCLLVPNMVVRCYSDIYAPAGWKFEPDALAYSKPLKLISHQG